MCSRPLFGLANRTNPTLVLVQARKYVCFIDANGFQFAEIDAQGSQDRRRDLGSYHRSLYHMVVQFRVRDDQGDIGVAKTKTAVFGILFG